MKKGKIVNLILSMALVCSLLYNPMDIHAEEIAVESIEETEDEITETTENEAGENQDAAITEVTDESLETEAEEITEVTDERSKAEAETITDATDESLESEGKEVDTEIENPSERKDNAITIERIASGYIKSSNSELQVLSYEEFKQALGNGTDTFSGIEAYAEEQKVLSDIMYNIDLNYKLSVDVSIISDSDASIAPMTLPVPNLDIYVYNMDSLKDGAATTRTVLLWIYNDSDIDGDTIEARYVEGFPEGYKLGEYYDSDDTEIGFVTNFFNPGEYTVDYYIMDSNEEINAIRYTIDILPVGGYNEYNGDLASSDEVDTYTIPIDYSSISTAAITFIQSGDTNMVATITDEDGKEVKVLKTIDSCSRRWLFIDKPGNVSGIYNYTVTVQASEGDYHADSNGYKIAAGSKTDVEEMISYVNGAVVLGKYTATDDTYDYRTQYTPSNFESYYKITADGAATITALTYYPETRFKILDAKTMVTLYDSENDDSAHRAQEEGSYIEKQRLGFSAGREYYLVLYANSPIASFVERGITLSQGMGRLKSGYGRFSAKTYITAGTSTYSPSATISINSGVPQTAEVQYVDYVSSDGVNLSDIKSFRVKPQYGQSVWYNSSQYNMRITLPYTDDGKNNTPLMGDWLYGFQASLKTKTMMPLVTIYYRYEYGD